MCLKDVADTLHVLVLREDSAAKIYTHTPIV